jgi:histidyl-tRNA synthetase
VPDAKRLRKYDDVIKGLRSLETLSTALANFGMQSLIDNKNASTTSEFHLPIYLSIDLGLRHRRKLHGPLVFHATILHDDYFQPYMYDDPIGSSKGVVVAEGGRYDDLVLKFSPPGNFISVPMVGFIHNATSYHVSSS